MPGIEHGALVDGGVVRRQVAGESGLLPPRRPRRGPGRRACRSRPRRRMVVSCRRSACTACCAAVERLRVAGAGGARHARGRPGRCASSARAVVALAQAHAPGTATAPRARTTATPHAIARRRSDAAQPPDATNSATAVWAAAIAVVHRRGALLQVGDRGVARALERGGDVGLPVVVLVDRPVGDVDRVVARLHLGLVRREERGQQPRSPPAPAADPTQPSLGVVLAGGELGDPPVDRFGARLQIGGVGAHHERHAHTPPRRRPADHGDDQEHRRASPRRGRAGRTHRAHSVAVPEAARPRDRRRGRPPA